MSATKAYLAAHDNDLQTLVDKYELSMHRHPTLPLCVLNYRRGMLRKQIGMEKETSRELKKERKKSTKRGNLVDEQSVDADENVQVHKWVAAADDAVVAECRGLVVEIEENDRSKSKEGKTADATSHAPDRLRFVRVVAQGFARFWHIRGIQTDDDFWTLHPTRENLQKLSLVNSGFDFSRPFTVPRARLIIQRTKNLGLLAYLILMKYPTKKLFRLYQT
jgi:hypothetical protein